MMWEDRRTGYDSDDTIGTVGTDILPPEPASSSEDEDTLFNR